MSFPDASASDVGGVELDGESFKDDSLVTFPGDEVVLVEVTLTSSVVAFEDIFCGEAVGELCEDVACK